MHYGMFMLQYTIQYAKVLNVPYQSIYLMDGFTF